VAADRRARRRAPGVDGDVGSVVATAAVVALVARGVLTWPDIAKRTEWGVLRSGGGLTLSLVCIGVIVGVITVVA
jgi:hypothetical protein